MGIALLASREITHTFPFFLELVGKIKNYVDIVSDNYWILVVPT
jgi:hypothetical protein